MKLLIGIILFLVIIYCLCGVVMGLYEMSQTDDPFDPMTIITWLPKMLK